MASDENRLPFRRAAFLYAVTAGYNRLTGENNGVAHRRFSANLDFAFNVSRELTVER